MKDGCHKILCVDDEKNILNSIKRLLRKEDYQLITASSAKEGLKILAKEDISLVISDHRMPKTSGTEFLRIVKEQYPDVIRIILTGYTEVDAITESINKGNIYKFLLKPWNDHNLKIEVKNALEQYDLIMTNKELHHQVIEKNDELRQINENLEALVEKRTQELSLQNKALEFSRSVLDDLPISVVGISSDGMIVLINQMVISMFKGKKSIEIGKDITSFFSQKVKDEINIALADNRSIKMSESLLKDGVYDLEIIPLQGRFHGRGILMTIKPLN